MELLNIWSQIKTIIKKFELSSGKRLNHIVSFLTVQFIESVKKQGPNIMVMIQQVNFMSELND